MVHPGGQKAPGTLGHFYTFRFQVANKKGMSRSFLSATKRLFGSPRPGGTGGTAGQAQGGATFSPDAPELQLRRLGDLYFIFSSYSNAFQVGKLSLKSTSKNRMNCR